MAAVDDWAKAKGLIALLKTLTPRFAHLLSTKDGRCPWEPVDFTTREVKRAYKKATLLLHPEYA